MTNVNLLFKHLRVLKFRSYPLGAKIGACNSSFARASVAKRQCKTQVLLMRLIMRGMRGMKIFGIVMMISPVGLCMGMKRHQLPDWKSEVPGEYHDYSL